MTLEHELTQDLLKLAGYEVVEDVDQPGLYTWIRRENGQTVGGCDMSLPTADEAWDEVCFMVREVLVDEAEIDADTWKEMSAEERQRVIIEQFC